LKGERDDLIKQLGDARKTLDAQNQELAGLKTSLQQAMARAAAPRSAAWW